MNPDERRWKETTFDDLSLEQQQVFAAALGAERARRMYYYKHTVPPSGAKDERRTPRGDAGRARGIDGSMN